MKIPKQHIVFRKSGTEPHRSEYWNPDSGFLYSYCHEGLFTSRSRLSRLLEIFAMVMFASPLSTLPSVSPPTSQTRQITSCTQITNKSRHPWATLSSGEEWREGRVVREGYQFPRQRRRLSIWCLPFHLRVLSSLTTPSILLSLMVNSILASLLLFTSSFWLPPPKQPAKYSPFAFDVIGITLLQLCSFIGQI